MPFGLHWHTGTVIADGRVVVTGGSRQPNQLVGVNYQALIWDPRTGQWTTGAATPTSPAYARLYHSNALLLPDATILVGGGGAPGPVVNTNAQIYYPPYLYNSVRRLSGPAEDHQRARPAELGPDVRPRDGPADGDRAGHADQDRLGDPRLQHGGAVHATAVHRAAAARSGFRRRPTPTLPRRAATCCSCWTRQGVPSIAKVVAL